MSASGSTALSMCGVAAQTFLTTSGITLAPPPYPKAIFHVRVTVFRYLHMLWFGSPIHRVDVGHTEASVWLQQFVGAH